jgi:hypothetical protein
MFAIILVFCWDPVLALPLKYDITFLSAFSAWKTVDYGGSGVSLKAVAKGGEGRGGSE